jgi:hypothetical protein
MRSPVMTGYLNKLDLICGSDGRVGVPLKQNEDGEHMVVVIVWCAFMWLGIILLSYLFRCNLIVLLLVYIIFLCSIFFDAHIRNHMFAVYYYDTVILLTAINLL